MALRLFRPFGLNTASQSRYCLWQYALHCAPPISPLRAQYGFAELRLFRPFGLNTALRSFAYFAPSGSIRLRRAPPISPLRAQYGFVAVLCARFTARIRTAFFGGGAIPAPFGRYAASLRPTGAGIKRDGLACTGVALRLPWAVFWRPFRAPHSLTKYAHLLAIKKHWR